MKTSLTQLLFLTGKYRFENVILNSDVVTRAQVGLILDMGIEEELIQRHLQVADATRATLGLPVLEYTITDAPLQVR